MLGEKAQKKEKWYISKKYTTLIQELSLDLSSLRVAKIVVMNFSVLNYSFYGNELQKNGNTHGQDSGALYGCQNGVFNNRILMVLSYFNAILQ